MLILHCDPRDVRWIDVIGPLGEWRRILPHELPDRIGRRIALVVDGVTIGTMIGHHTFTRRRSGRGWGHHVAFDVPREWQVMRSNYRKAPMSMVETKGATTP